MDSALRPREIQARIRAGESPDDVARAAGIPVERIEPYAGPVLAERDHVAGLARQHPVRRRSETSSHRLLGATVTESLSARGVPAGDPSWDAWKLSDRRWRIQVSFAVEDRSFEADFVYEQAGHFSLADNNTARELIGDDGRADAPPRPVSSDDELAIVRALQSERRRFGDVTDAGAADGRDLTDADDVDDAFHEGELTEVDGVYEIVQEPTSDLDVLYEMLSSFDEDSVRIYSGLVHPLEDTVPVIDADPGEDLSPLDTDGPGETRRATRRAPAQAPRPGRSRRGRSGPEQATPESSRPEPVPPPEEPEQLSLIDDVEPEPEPHPRPRTKKKRASVPTWDEIMFGGPKDAD